MSLFFIEFRPEFDELFSDMFNDIRLEALSNVESRLTEFALMGNINNIVDVSKVKNRVVERFRILVKKIYDKVGVGSSRNIDVHVRSVESHIESYVSNLNSKIVDAASTVSSVAALSNTIDGFGIEDRGLVWAEVEFASAAQSAHVLSAVKEGMRFKKWVTVDDSRVRHSHKNMHNVEVPIDSLFETLDGPAMMPLDPRLPPEGRINCRCFLAFVE